MQEFFPFFIILLVAVVFSQLFVRMRVPWVVALIVGGIISGPSVLGLFTPNETIDFLAAIGLILLMFMAGAESRISDIGGLKKTVFIIGFCIGFIPAAVGILITLGLGYELTTAVLMGIIFMSSAIAMLIPQFQEKNIIDLRVGKVIVAATVTIDALSLVVLSVFLQIVEPGGTSSTPLPVYLLVIAALVGLLRIMPRIQALVALRSNKNTPDIFERELRFMLLALIGLVVLFEFIGLHAIIAGFFGGMILSKALADNPLLKAKMHAISYGFFVPIFFVVVGASTDPSVFAEGSRPIQVTAVILASLMVSKFAGGWLGGKLSGFNSPSSVLIGVSALPQLSTTLAVAFLGFGEGLLDQVLLSALVGLTIVTSVVAPILVNLVGDKVGKTAGANTSHPD